MALILAAGRSARSPGHKACRLHRGAVWLRRQCRDLRQSGCSEIRVVVGFSAHRVARCAPPYVRITRNKHPARGPFSSIQAGLKNIRQTVLIVPVDTPPPSRATLCRLRHALQCQQAAIPIWRGRGGHPVLLSAEFSVAVGKLPWSAAARLDVVLRGSLCVRLSVQDRSVAKNLNRPRDWLSYIRNPQQRRPVWTH